jgi:hypothetical protein
MSVAQATLSTTVSNNAASDTNNHNQQQTAINTLTSDVSTLKSQVSFFYLNDYF